MCDHGHTYPNDQQPRGTSSSWYVAVPRSCCGAALAQRDALECPRVRRALLTLAFVALLMLDLAFVPFAGVLVMVGGIDALIGGYISA